MINLRVTHGDLYQQHSGNGELSFIVSKRLNLIRVWQGLRRKPSNLSFFLAGTVKTRGPGAPSVTPHLCFDRRACLFHTEGQFRGGLAFKAHMYPYHSTSGSRVIRKKTSHQGIFWLYSIGFPIPHPHDPSYAPAVLPTVKSMLVPDCSRNPLAVRYVVS